MIRKAFKMFVNPECHAEYERRHSPIWPELEAVLRAHGVHAYSIYLDEASSELVGVVELESEEQWAKIASTDVCRRWWDSMAHLMSTEPDHRPRSRDLREVFRLDRPK